MSLLKQFKPISYAVVIGVGIGLEPVRSDLYKLMGYLKPSFVVMQGNTPYCHITIF